MTNLTHIPEHSPECPWPTRPPKTAEIVRLSTDNLEADGYDTRKLSQDELDTMASEIAELYWNSEFWQHVIDVAERHGFRCQPSQ
ncbi:MAG: hypothetical protein AAF438_23595 [Pseudomonadota bacterium]